MNIIIEADEDLRTPLSLPTAPSTACAGPMVLQATAPAPACPERAGSDGGSEREQSKSDPKALPFCATIGNLGSAAERYRQKDYPDAWKTTLAAIQARPFHPEAYLLLGQIALAAGDVTSAKRCAQHARALAPGWKPAARFLKSCFRGEAKLSWLALPDSIAITGNPPPPRLTACLIARNEERFLGQCLASIRGLADQIVIVDTGSTDRTIEIARTHGAEIYHFTWCDDFSAARNAALEQARGDWVLILDADEELPPTQHAQLRADLARQGTIAYRLPIVNYGRENEGRCFVPRLFRNAPGAHFTRRIHEQVFNSLLPYARAWGLTSHLSEATLVHHGYSPEIRQERKKQDRNLKLLHQAVAEDPDDINILMNLGLEVVRSGELQSGLAHYRKAFRLASRVPKEISPELREGLLTQLAAHLRRAQEHQEVVDVLTSPLAAAGNVTATMHLALGLSYYKLRQFAAAAEQMRMCLRKVDDPALSTVNTETRTALPCHCLALSLIEQGDAAGAERAFKAGLAKSGHIDELKLDYARFLRDQNQPLDGLRLLHEFVSENPTSKAAWTLGGEIALSRPEYIEFARDWTEEAVKHISDDIGLLAQRAEALLLTQNTIMARGCFERLWVNEKKPQVLAALILCELTEGTISRAPANKIEEAAASQSFVLWYRKLLTVEAKETVLTLNARVAELRRVLPLAADVLEAALAEAQNHNIR